MTQAENPSDSRLDAHTLDGKDYPAETADAVESTIGVGVGSDIEVQNAGWTFGEAVADSFAEHVRQSIPMYEAGHEIICQLSDYFVQDDSICYEIGVSVGELIAKLARHNEAKQALWVGLDVEPSMIQRARETVKGSKNVSLEVADVTQYDFQKADLIVSYYCIQFIRPKHRQQLIDRIYESLNWGGAFIWFEKVRGADARFQDILTTLYNDFKLEQGLNPDEIVAKTRSLKGVMEPFSTQGDLDLLARAGFLDVMTVMKHLCFEGFLAIK